METQILPITDESLILASKILNGGGLIGMPTETVYGLAAIGTMGEAVKKIYEVKGRPADNPLICHVHKDYDLNNYSSMLPDFAKGHPTVQLPHNV